MGTTFTLRLAATAAAIATTAGLAAAVPAAAETQTHSDPRGDVEGIRFDTAAAPKPDIDVVRATNTYRGRTLTLALKFDGLQRRGYGTQWQIRTPDSEFVFIYDRSEAGQPQVIFFETSGPLGRLGARRVAPGGPPTCEGVEARRKGASVIGTVPRSCLGGADEVRVAGVAVEPQSQPGRVRADDSRRKGLNENGTAKFGPVLERN